MSIALSGTRSPLSSFQVATLSGVLQSLPATTTLLIGCCPTGLDLAARCLAPHHHTYLAASPTPAALRSRTLAMVAASSTLIAWPRSLTYPHSGTWLAVFAAASAGIPVFVLPPTPLGFSPASLPRVRGIASWQSNFTSLPVSQNPFPVRFFTPVSPATQISFPI